MSTLTHLSLPAFDVLWEDLRAGTFPFPLDIDHHGTTLDERARIRSAVYADLERRNLARRGRPEPDLEDALRLIARPALKITVMGLVADELLRALVAARGGYAVLAVQAEDGVRLDVLRDRSPAMAAVSVLPWSRPGPGRTVTVPASSLVPKENTGFTQRVRTSAGDDVTALGTMLAGPFTGTGHFSITTDTGVLPPLTWIDTARGRYVSTGTDWITVAPADNDALAQWISRALAAPRAR
ncbi:ESX secretion-associated protein EspG [Actinosynnema sp. CA-248983]